MSEEPGRCAKRERRPLADELDDIARECAALPVLDNRPADEILGYDDRRDPPTPPADGEGRGRLARLRGARLAVIIGWVGLLPAAALLRLFTRSESLALGLCISWLALTSGASVFLATCRCPRCGNHFHVDRAGALHVWTRTCRNCGLDAF